MLENLFKKTDLIHFCGIGGIGMSGIAKILRELGFKTQGTEINADNKQAKMLKELGCNIFNEHHKDNLKSVTHFITTNTINPNNPEYMSAISKNIPIIRRGELLSDLVSGFKNKISITGTHGKTTITSIISCIFHEHFKASFLVGGVLSNYNTNAKLDSRDFVVCESDESDATMLMIDADISVLSNISLEHMEFYKNEESLMKTYEVFFNQHLEDKKLICCIDDKRIESLFIKTNAFKTKNFITYGFSEKADYQITDMSYKNGLNFCLKTKNNKTKNFNIPVLLGEHNALNATASIIVALEYGISEEKIQQYFSFFLGTHRRMEFVGEIQGCKVYDDYAHHPNEIQALYNGLNSVFSNYQVIIEPHKYSRLNDCFEDFVNVIKNINTDVFITEVYNPTFKSSKDKDHLDLVNEVKKHGKNNIFFIQDDEILKILSSGKDTVCINAGSLSYKIKNLLT
jgi:UDP-N-acetylmuramate--alanine ligase